MPARVQQLWDDAVLKMRKHPRRYSVLTFIFIFLPQWLPAFSNAVRYVYSLSNSGIQLVKVYWPSLSSWTPSWNWVTAPVGLWLLYRIWSETGSPPVLRAIARQNDGRPSRVPAGTLDIRWKPGADTLDIEIENVSRAVLECYGLAIFDLRIWVPDLGQFMETSGVHGSGPFSAIDLHTEPSIQSERGLVSTYAHSYKLTPRSPMTFLFLRRDGDQVQFGGAVGSQLRIHVIRPPGVWQVLLRSHLSSPTSGISRSQWGLARDHVMFFYWDGISRPQPCSAPRLR